MREMSSFDLAFYKWCFEIGHAPNTANHSSIGALQPMPMRRGTARLCHPFSDTSLLYFCDSFGLDPLFVTVGGPPLSDTSCDIFLSWIMPSTVQCDALYCVISLIFVDVCICSAILSTLPSTSARDENLSRSVSFLTKTRLVVILHCPTPYFEFLLAKDSGSARRVVRAKKLDFSDV